MATVATSRSGFRDFFDARWTRLRLFAYLLRRSPLAVLGLVLILGFVVLAVFAPVLAPPAGDDPYEMDIDVGVRPQPPSPEHPFGTTENNADLWYGVVWGSRISMIMGVGVVGAALFIGTLLGAIAGYVGGRTDEIIMRVTDVFLAVPILILAMGVAAGFGRTLFNLGLALTIIAWPTYTRLVRGQVLSIKEHQYIEAARALGLSQPRIILRHILPNTVSPLIVQATMDVGQIVLVAAGLAFIGFASGGPLLPEWGSLINTGREYITSAWWAIFYPGAAIFGFVLGFNLFGDGLRDILDPRLRK